MQQHIIMLVAKKQAPRCQHLCALTLVYTFAVRVFPPLRWRLNVAEGPVLYVLPRPLTRVSPRSPPSCYLFDRVSSVAPHINHKPSLHQSISISQTHKQTRCARWCHCYSLSKLRPIRHIRAHRSPHLPHPISDSNCLCNLSLQSLDDYGALCPSHCRGVLEDVHLDS